jgi:hypothetical protein
MRTVDYDGVLLRFVRSLGLHPVLMDIGASGEVPEVWAPIAPESVYIGFDPDLRELSETAASRFLTRHVVNAAVVPEGIGNEATIFLTRSPFCSSTLEPDIKALSSFLFADLFEVERTASVPAITTSQALEQLGLDRVHWFKTDSQGTDLRLFTSLPDRVRERVLAVDVEPGLIDAYRGEDLFVAAHAYFAGSGYWLSNLHLGGAVRMREATLREIGGLERRTAERAVRMSPGWCEARYLLTLEALESPEFGPGDWQMAWVFAMADRQWGFALDLAFEYARRFGKAGAEPMMVDLPLACIRSAAHTPTWRRVVRSVVPSALTRIARSVLLGGDGVRL